MSAPAEKTTETTVSFTENAQKYLASLIDQQEEDVLGLRMFINDPGTPRGETCLSYCREKDLRPDDVTQQHGDFLVYFEARSLPFLEEAEVDYLSNSMGGQLTIKAPFSRMPPKIGADSTIEDRINYVLYSEINPALAAHGGEVRLVEVVEDSVAVLQFGGGCQGCGMVDATLKDGVERTLCEQIPELREVRDMTDHSFRENAYFR